MTTTQQLPPSDIQKLRSAGIVKEDENVVREGTLLVAVNVLTGNKRIVEASGILLESGRQVLRD